MSRLRRQSWFMPAMLDEQGDVPRRVPARNRPGHQNRSGTPAFDDAARELWWPIQGSSLAPRAA